MTRPSGPDEPTPDPSNEVPSGAPEPTSLSRRAFLAGAGAAGLGPVLLHQDQPGSSRLAGATLDRANARPSPPSPPQGGALDVRAMGARGDGRTDDTLAVQRALDASAAVVIPYTPDGFRIDGTLHPRSDQTLYGEGYFVAGSHAVMWDFAAVLNASVLGSLWISDPHRRTQGNPAVRFRAQCRWLSIDRLRVDGCTNPVELVDINESRFGEIHLTDVRGTGIRITNAPVCNVHDNDIVSATIVGAPGSQSGLVFDSALNGTIGGNRWQAVTILSMGQAGLLVQNTGFREQWFGTLLCDTCRSDGVHLYGGTERFFFGQLWCSSNGSNGFYANGSSEDAGVSDILIDQFYGHNNAGAAGFFLDGYCSRISVGTLYAVDHPGGAGVRFDKATNGFQVANLVTYGNGVGLTDAGDPSSSNIQVALANLADGTSLTATQPTILSRH